MGPHAPSVVKNAERLLWLSAAIAALFSMAGFVGLLPAGVPRGAGVILSVVASAILALCAAKIGIGRNWARWVMLGYCLLGLLMLSVVVIASSHALILMPTQILVFAVVQSVIQIAALILVFKPTARRWFSQFTPIA